MVFVGGSFVTSKEFPGDYDACWDTVGVRSPPKTDQLWQW